MCQLNLIVEAARSAVLTVSGQAWVYWNSGWISCVCHAWERGVWNECCKGAYCVEDDGPLEGYIGAWGNNNMDKRKYGRVGVSRYQRESAVSYRSETGGSMRFFGTGILEGISWVCPVQFGRLWSRIGTGPLALLLTTCVALGRSFISSSLSVFICIKATIIVRTSEHCCED